MDLNTEIRKLSPIHLYGLVQILEYDESWKKLMAVIPKNLFLDNYECKITINNLPKYNTDHFKLIDAAGDRQRRACAEILLEEWGTSGRIRPRLGHLITLLKKTELFRAADYVAMDLLKMTEVERPSTGPAAKVDIPKDDQLQNRIAQNISLNYPSSLLEGDAIPSSIINELMNPPPQHVIPTIIINEAEDQLENLDRKTNTEDVLNLVHDMSLSNEANSLIETSNENSNIDNENQNINYEIPALTSLLSRENSHESIVETMNNNIAYISGPPDQQNNLPAFSAILNTNSDQNFIPALSILNNSPANITRNSNEIIDLQCSQNYVPAFSILNNTEETSQNSEYIPAFSEILTGNNQISQNHSNNEKNSITPNQFCIQNSNNQQLNLHQNPITDEQNYIPALSILNNSPERPGNQSFNSDYIPAFSDILNSSEQSMPDSNSSNSQNLPINILNYSSISGQNTSDENIPAFSQILNTTSSELSSSEIPLLTELLNNKPNLSLSPATSGLSVCVSPIVPQSGSRTCISPLPNLLLKTVLPHFTYQELEQCTRNFDESILNSQDQNLQSGRKLGSGAFGTVYLGIGLLDKPIAVKKLNLNGVNVVNVDDTVTKQFKNEVELLCKYKHENLLSLLGYSCDGPTYCLIYEYISGGALKDRLQNSLKLPEQFRLLWTDRLYIALGTAKAVSYLHSAHSMPLIHRDIKSANILLDSVNKPKLCDFGLIKLTPNPNTNTSTTVFGTSAYMAPEAFRGDVSVKLDTFSFGVVLLELLTSLPPLDENREGNDLVTHVEEVCEDDIKPLLDLNAGSWFVNNINFGDKIYEIAIQCIEEKKRRPVMSEVVKQLSELINKSA